jgi:hypothetical protein
VDQLAKRGGASPESVASGEILCGEFKLQPTTSLQQDFNFGMGHFSQALGSCNVMLCG